MSHFDTLHGSWSRLVGAANCSLWTVEFVTFLFMFIPSLIRGHFMSTTIRLKKERKKLGK
jgi:hypothetical protein